MQIIIHIGGAKCGSTAIQYSLAMNRDILHKLGFLVPSKTLDITGKINGEQLWFFENTVASQTAHDIVRHKLQVLQDHMQSENLHTLILSAENLINPGPFARMMASALSLFDDVRIVLYIRRQDEYMASAWQQWYLKTFPSLDSYVNERLGTDANWNALIRQWEEIFETHRISVRRFLQTSLTEGDVVADFYQWAGITRDDLAVSNLVVNPSFSEHLGNLAHRAQDLFKSMHDNEFYERMTKAIGSASFKKTTGSMLFSLSERRRIVAAYEMGNGQLKARYFPELSEDEPLFPLPSEADVVEINDIEQLRAENSLLLRAVYDLLTRIEKIEESVKSNQIVD